MSTLPSTTPTLIFDPPASSLSLQPHPITLPNPEKQEHLIRVHATAPCARELTWPILYPSALYSDNPLKIIIPCYDLAGTVLSAPSSSAFPPGSEIYCRTRPNRPGNARKYTLARAEEMALKPKGLSWVEAASVPLSAISAWQALFEHGGVNGLGDEGSKGKRVLITAAAGGVGVWLVQLARVAGLEVIAQVGKEENEEFVRELGAHDVIKYHRTGLKEWAERKSEADIVIDCVGGKTLEECWYAVKDDGVLVSIVDEPEKKKPTGLEKGARSLFFIMTPRGEHLMEISKLLEEGKVRPVVDSVWKLADYGKVFEKCDGGHAKGKIVIELD